MLMAKARQSGFTLVEAMVAMGIFALVIASGLIGVQRGFESVGNARHYSRTSQIMQSEIERLRSFSWSELQELDAIKEIQPDSEFAAEQYDDYTVYRTIEDVEPDLSRVQIYVFYENENGQSQSFRYKTYFTKGGLNDYYYRTI